MDFTLRIYQSETNTSLAWFNYIEISDILLIVKDTKFSMPRVPKGTLKKFKHRVNIKGTFYKVGGTNSTPCISFKGKYIDLEIKNFPRYPVFCQDHIYARNWMNGYMTKYVGNGFPIWSGYRKIEILNLVNSK